MKFSKFQKSKSSQIKNTVVVTKPIQRVTDLAESKTNFNFNLPKTLQIKPITVKIDKISSVSFFISFDFRKNFSCLVGVELQYRQSQILAPKKKCTDLVHTPYSTLHLLTPPASTSACVGNFRPSSSLPEIDSPGQSSFRNYLLTFCKKF